VHCAWYGDADHAIELTRHYLQEPERRARIAEAGRSHALAHHTYANRLELLLRGEGYPLPTIL
jgi:spore maturation protein CgeB